MDAILGKYAQTVPNAMNVGAIVGEHLFETLADNTSIFLLTKENWREALETLKFDFFIIEYCQNPVVQDWHKWFEENSQENREFIRLIKAVRSCNIPIVYWLMHSVDFHRINLTSLHASDLVCCNSKEQYQECQSADLNSIFIEPYFQPTRAMSQTETHPEDFCIGFMNGKDLNHVERKENYLANLIKRAKNSNLFLLDQEETKARNWTGVKDSVIRVPEKGNLIQYYEYFDVWVKPANRYLLDDINEICTAVAQNCLVIAEGKEEHHSLGSYLSLQVESDKFEEYFLEYLTREKKQIDRFLHRHWRRVHAAHTFLHRMLAIKFHLHGRLSGQLKALPGVTLYSFVQSAEECAEAIRKFDCFNYPDLELILWSEAELEPHDIEFGPQTHSIIDKQNGNGVLEIATGELIFCLDIFDKPDELLEVIYRLRQKQTAEVGQEEILKECLEGPKTIDCSGIRGNTSDIRAEKSISEPVQLKTRKNKLDAEVDRTLVSIVVPIFDKKDYLQQTVRSILNQTHFNLEIILVDDGSTDGSSEILAGFSLIDQRIKVITQRNQGLSVARNTGLSAATGQYILFFDADDYLFESTVSKLLRLAVHDEADIVTGLFERVKVRAKRGKSKKKVEKRIKAHWQVWHRNVNLSNDPKLVQLYRSHISACNKLFRVDFLRDLELEFVPKLYMQDLEFWMRAMFLAKNISFSPILVGEYWIRESGASRIRSTARFESLITLYEGLDKFYLVNGLDEFCRYRNEAIISAAVHFFVRWFLEEIDNPDFKERTETMARLLQSIPIDHYSGISTTKEGKILLAFRNRDYDQASELAQINRKAKVNKKRSLAKNVFLRMIKFIRG